MSAQTTNYNLVKPDTNEYYDVTIGNNNLDIIDEKLKDLDTQSSDMDYQLATGTATVITLTMQTLRNGYAKTFIASVNNGGSPTTINSKPLYKPGTTTAPNLITGKAYTVWYNSTGGCFFIKASAEGNALATHVLKDKTFSNDNDTGLAGTLDLSNLVTANIKSGVTINGVSGSGTVVDTANAVLDPAYLVSGYSGYDDGVLKAGTMPNLSGNWQGAAFKGISGTSILAQIPRGYSDGGINTYTACNDGNFIASNILSGKSIFGLAGSAEQSHIVSGTIATPAYSNNTTKIYLGFSPKALVIKFPVSGGNYYIFYFQGFCWAGINANAKFESQSPYITSVDSDGFTISNTIASGLTGAITYEAVG